MAKNTRGPVIIDPLSVPNVEMHTAADTNTTPAVPTTAAAPPAATSLLPAIADSGTTRVYANVAARYSTATAAVPSTNARGRLRCGSETSPDTNPTSDQPS